MIYKNILINFFKTSTIFLFSINIIFLLSNICYAQSSDTENNLNINARSYIVIDRKNMQVLVGKNEYNKVKMASTTKIMTATIIIENCNLSDIATISKKSAKTGGSRLGLKENDKISINDLLYGLLLCSGNDAAIALAEYCSESVPKFCDLMNKKASDLGLKNSHFESPHGLDSDNHYTTSYELAVLTDYALKSDVFKNIVGTKKYTININGYPRNILNTNELLGTFDGIYGVKTGFTNGANRCLVTSCKRNNLDLICVVLGCDTKKFRGQDSIKLLSYCFENFEEINIEELLINKLNSWKKDNSNYFNIYKGKQNNLDITYSKLNQTIITMPKDKIQSLNINLSIDKDLNAPISKGNLIGTYKIQNNNKAFNNTEFQNNNDALNNDEIIYQGNILADTEIQKKTLFDYIQEFFKKFFI